MISADWASLYAALVAVIGGAAAYWNQKRIDHRLELAREKRDAYREFLASIRVYERRAIRAGMPEAVEPRRAAVEQYLGALSTLQVFAPASVFEASEKADRSFKKYVELLRKHYEEKTASDADVKSAEKEFSADFRALISVMRNDIKSG